MNSLRVARSRGYSFVLGGNPPLRKWENAGCLALRAGKRKLMLTGRADDPVRFSSRCNRSLPFLPHNGHGARVAVECLLPIRGNDLVAVVVDAGKRGAGLDRAKPRAVQDERDFRDEARRRHEKLSIRRLSDRDGAEQESYDHSAPCYHLHGESSSSRVGRVPGVFVWVPKARSAQERVRDSVLILGRTGNYYTRLVVSPIPPIHGLARFHSDISILACRSRTPRRTARPPTRSSYSQWSQDYDYYQ